MPETAQISLRHLRVFAHVAALNSVRRAAQAVSLSQPAVTQAMTRLEETTGVQLFDRTASGSFLRPEGEILARRAGLMFAQIEAALADFGIVGGRNGGRGMSVEQVIRRITRPQVRALVEVAASASFADAARKLGVSTVALHRAARDLERNLGKPIFVAGQSGFVATRAAEELARRLSIALHEIDWAMEEIAAAQGHRGGTLRLGAMPLAGGFLLGQVLDEIMQQFPQARAFVHTADGRDLLARLRRGELDIVVGMNRATPDTDELVQEALVASPFVVIARRGHPLAAKARVTVADLEGHDWIVPTSGASRRAVFDGLFARMTVPPVPNIEANSLSMIRSLLNVSDRLTLLTRFEFDFEQGGGDLAVLPFEPIAHAHAIGVTQRRNWTPTALHQTFLRVIRARAGAVAQGGQERGGQERSAADKFCDPAINSSGAPAHPD